VTLANNPKPKRLKQETRHWNSGAVRFSVIGIEGHPEDNYIILEKLFFGRSPQKDQRFNLRERDWRALKRQIDGGIGEKGLTVETRWTPTVLSDAELAHLVGTRPELLEVILSAPNLGQFTEPSLQSLDRLANQISDVKREQIELIFERLAAASDKGVEEFSALLRDLQLEHVASLAGLIHQKLSCLDLLEKVALNPRKSERAVHQIFELNPWLLGKGFEIVQSDHTLATYLQGNAKADPTTRRRPDLIVKRTPHLADLVVVELKAPGIPLAAEHIGQVLGYKGLIQQYRPNVGEIHCFVFGYTKASTFTASRDVTMKTFSELINELRDEYSEYASVLENQRADEPTALPKEKDEAPTSLNTYDDIPF
jgi:hypothetical protein